MSTCGGGRRRGGNKHDNPLPRSVQISKKLSWLLRHGAAEEHLQLGPGGFANLADVLANRKLRGFNVSLDEIRELVRDNDKQRFTLRLKSDDDSTAHSSSDPTTGDVSGNLNQDSSAQTSSTPRDYIIRANQGHSLAVDNEGLLTPLLVGAADLPATVVHGTTHAAWPAIVASGGLKTMTRTHVHFARGLPAGFDANLAAAAAEQAGAVNGAAAAQQQPAVISGMRNTSTILIYIDLPKALEQGIAFWASENGVVLSAGETETGVVPISCFQRVVDRSGEGELVRDGAVVKDAPAHWGKGKKKR